MEITSKEKLQKYQRLGMTLVINFNERKESVTGEDGKKHTQFRYTVAKVCKTSSRDERIEAIIKTHYPTYGAELAAMHKGNIETEDYNAFRELAKQVATESFA